MTDGTDPSDLRDLSAQVVQQRQAFLDAVATIRPQLHRYCTKMTGSVLDGEDVVQEALGHAFFKIHTLEDPARLKGWLFRIAHRRALDHLRRRRAVRAPDEPDDVPAPPAADPIEVADAVGRLVTSLPPKERACVILKDVLGLSLDEVAAIVDSTSGGVKSALHRGRGKLAATRTGAREARAPNAAEQALIRAYLERFNERDWDGVAALIREDARLDVVDRAARSGRDAITQGYFGNYSRLPWTWRLQLADVDGETMVVHFRDDGHGWQPHAPVRFAIEDGRVVGITDYVHVAYMLRHAQVDAIDRGE